ncbi:MAG TPA: PA0069 family radical SAM protein [Candidatus Sulfotelmatobacter sp.]|jgi:DNA repair photolyase|nr:PA0069 family radical SAM protein [Candidatus Sulfotelmatobacter sp.]
MIQTPKDKLVVAHRGAPANPPNRFEPIVLEPDADWDPEQDALPRTQFLRDASATVITYNDSPDLGFRAGLNPYRGCEHGCIYCYARPTHEYLGFSAGLDFESKIMVKLDAPRLLREALSSPKWKPQEIFISGITDCYQPVERKLKLTRGCLEVLAEFRNPVGMVTKNALITRDIDLLAELARHGAASVAVSITTLDAKLRGIMEPRTSPPAARLEAIRQLAAAKIPVGVAVAPVIPGLTDHEMPAILKAAAAAGATYAWFTIVRLPHGVAPLFEQWLETHFPDRKEKILNRIKAMRGGKMYDSRWGTRMSGEGIFAEQIAQMFDVARRKAGIANAELELSTAAFRLAGGTQMSLFS